MISAKHLRRYIIQPVLEHLSAWNPALSGVRAENLLLGTAAHESRLGYYLRQEPRGPARGIYQMERLTEGDLYGWVQARPALATLVNEWTLYDGPEDEELVGNLYLATAYARLYYWRAPEALPPSTDIPGIAALWKLRWNTPRGAGTVQEFIGNYARYVDAG